MEEDKNKVEPGNEGNGAGPTGGSTTDLGGDIKKKADKVKKIEVDADVLQSILEKVEKMEKDNKKKDEKIEMLESVADKGRVANYQQKNARGELIRHMRAWIWRKKIVMASVTLRNDSFYDAQNRAFVDQVLKVIFEDGTEAEVSYAQFNKEKEYLPGEVISRTSSEHGDFVTLRFKDGKEKAMNILFLN